MNASVTYHRLDSASAVNSNSIRTTRVKVSEKSGLSFTLQRVIAGVGLLLISPLLAVVAMAIRIESRGPAMFLQTRIGEHGHLFKIYKFRSMYLQDDPKWKAPDAATNNRDGICQKFFHDPRVTRVGRIIRKLSIDELPQLLNVVSGDMALVGPRPALPREVNAYQYSVLKRLNCKPGITGLWQVSGRANTTFDEQVELDVRYVEQRNAFMDIKIILATVPAVLLAKGAY